MKRLLTYYGDDFTGSTDVMEALATHDAKTVLFTRLPTDSEFASFENFEAVGLAGTSRSQTPEWMDRNLPPAFDWLKSLAARFCHYKVCSTFDSSPTTGSIGRAAEIGATTFGQNSVPLIIGVPQLKRYTFGGNLFAGYQGQIYRIDRHPVMSRHPVTPMHEADMRLHLAQQTNLPVTLANTDGSPRGLVLLDIFDEASQLSAGRRLMDWSSSGATFLVGSSGVEYALMKALMANGESQGFATFAPLPAADRVMIVSGSVSPTTERQIRYGIANGFEAIAVDPLLLAGENQNQEIATAVEKSLALLRQNRSVIAFTALGAATDESEKLKNQPQARQRIGEALGQILRATLQQSGIRRAVIAGGDSSSHALGQLDIYALTTRFPLTATPGSPMCIAHSSDPHLNGLEIAMKGGQLGGDSYFVQLRDGLP